VIAYVDSSVILRVVLNQPARLPEWPRVLTGVTSSLAEVECLRTIDRLSVLGTISPADGAVRRETIHRILEELEVVEIESRVLRRASQPFAVPLGTLDAIHLSTAALWREAQGKEPVFASHDRHVALAARADGFRVVGV
jgi:predicted nucleic acid-binding protein